MNAQAGWIWSGFGTGVINWSYYQQELSIGVINWSCQLNQQDSSVRSKSTGLELRWLIDNFNTCTSIARPLDDSQWQI